MNYNLSVMADRVNGKCSYTLSSSGKVISDKISKFSGDNIKVNALNQLKVGLMACKNLVSHDDILSIEVQNTHLCDWLNGRVAHKDYIGQLSDVFDVLETIDCRYRFLFNKEPFAKVYASKRDFTKIAVSTIDDMFKDFN